MPLQRGANLHSTLTNNADPPSFASMTLGRGNNFDLNTERNNMDRQPLAAGSLAGG